VLTPTLNSESRKFFKHSPAAPTSARASSMTSTPMTDIAIFPLRLSCTTNRWHAWPSQMKERWELPVWCNGLAWVRTGRGGCRSLTSAEIYAHRVPSVLVAWASRLTRSSYGLFCEVYVASMAPAVVYYLRARARETLCRPAPLTSDKALVVCLSDSNFEI
jgi:hypothetical protein